ncbi:helix-turn-helix domain-containing protein [Oceanobacillus timonensis]|uniref:helix-turn-helix domain-containing protein n=1 Tax=Oceanobacillus timonensis TaxID=1926285 RepID=UPI0009BBF62E|nr:helix-turn-helix transcriptional regulator [Oceanobacillus timonensis]
MDIGNRIRNLRKAKGFNVTELANKSFISQSYLSDIETGRTAPSIDKLKVICDSLEISLGEFFGVVPGLPSNIIRLVENAQKLTEKEVQLLSDLLEEMVTRNQTTDNVKNLPDA